MEGPSATNSHGMTDMEWLEREQEKEMIELALERSLNDFQGSQTLHHTPRPPQQQPLHNSMPTIHHNGYDHHHTYSGRRNISSHSLDHHHLHHANNNHHQSFSHPSPQQNHRPLVVDQHERVDSRMAQMHRHSSYNNRQPDMYRNHSHNHLMYDSRGMEGRENSMRSLASSTQQSPVMHRTRPPPAVGYPRSASFREVEEMTETVVDSPHHHHRMGGPVPGPAVVDPPPNYHHGRMSPAGLGGSGGVGGPLHHRYSYQSPGPSSSAPSTPYTPRPTPANNFGRRSLPDYHHNLNSRPVPMNVAPPPPPAAVARDHHRPNLDIPRYEARNAVLATARQHLSEEEAHLVEQALNLAINPHQQQQPQHHNHQRRGIPQHQQPMSTDTQHSGGSGSSYGSRGHGNNYRQRMDGPPPSPPQQGSQASTLSARETMDLLYRASAYDHLSQEELAEIEQALNHNDRTARHNHNAELIPRSSHSSSNSSRQQHLHHPQHQQPRRDYAAATSHSDPHLMQHHQQHQRFSMHHEQHQPPPSQQHNIQRSTHSDPSLTIHDRNDPYNHRNSDPITSISAHPRQQQQHPQPRESYQSPPQQPQPPRNYRPNPRFAATGTTPRRTYSGDSLAMAKEEIARAMEANTLSPEEYAELMMAFESGSNHNKSSNNNKNTSPPNSNHNNDTSPAAIVTSPNSDRSRSPPRPTTTTSTNSPLNRSRRARPRFVGGRGGKGLPGRSISYDSATNASGSDTNSHQGSGLENNNSNSNNNKSRSWGDRPPRAVNKSLPRRSASYDSHGDWNSGHSSTGERSPIIPRHDWSPQRRRSSISSTASQQALAEIKEGAEPDPLAQSVQENVVVQPPPPLPEPHASHVNANVAVQPPPPQSEPLVPDVNENAVVQPPPPEPSAPHIDDSKEVAKDDAPEQVPVEKEENATEELRDEQEESSLQGKEEEEEAADSAEAEKAEDMPADDVRDKAEEEKEDESKESVEEPELSEQPSKAEESESQQLEGSFSSSSTKQTPRVFDLPPSNRQASTRLGTSQHSHNKRQQKLSSALAALPYARGAPGSVSVDMEYSVSQFGDSVNTFGSDFYNQQRGEESVVSVVSTDTDNSRTQNQFTLAMSPHTVTSKGTVRGVGLLPPTVFDGDEEEDEDDAENVVERITEMGPLHTSAASVASERTKERNNQKALEEVVEQAQKEEQSPEPSSNHEKQNDGRISSDSESDKDEENSLSMSVSGHMSISGGKDSSSSYADSEHDQDQQQQSNAVDEKPMEVEKETAEVAPSEGSPEEQGPSTEGPAEPVPSDVLDDSSRQQDSKEMGSSSTRRGGEGRAVYAQGENDTGEGEDRVHRQSRNSHRRVEREEPPRRRSRERLIDPVQSHRGDSRHSESQLGPVSQHRGDSRHSESQRAPQSFRGQQPETWREGHGGSRNDDHHHDHDELHYSQHHHRQRWDEEPRRGKNEFDYHQRDRHRGQPQRNRDRDRHVPEAGEFVPDRDRDRQQSARLDPYEREQFDRHRRDPRDDDFRADEDIPPAVPQQVQVEPRDRRESWISQGRQNSVSSLGESTQYSIFSSHFRQDEYERYRREDYERAMYERNWRPSQPPALPHAMRESPSRYYEQGPPEADHRRRSRLQQQHPSASSNEYSRGSDYRGSRESHVQQNAIPEHDRFDEDLKRALYLSMQMQKGSEREGGDGYEQDVQEMVDPIDSRLTREKLDHINRALSGTDDLRGGENIPTRDRFPGALDHQFESDRALRHDDRSRPMGRDGSDPTHDRIAARASVGPPIDSNTAAIAEAEEALSKEVADAEFALQVAKEEEERQSLLLARQLQEEEERRASMERAPSVGRFATAGQMPEVPFSAAPQAGAQRSSSPDRVHPAGQQQQRSSQVGAVRSSSPSRVRHPLEESYSSLHQSRSSQVGAVRSSSPDRQRHPLEESYSSVAHGRSSNQIGAVRSSSPDPATRHPLEESSSSLALGRNSQAATARTISPIRNHQPSEEAHSPRRSPRGPLRQTFEESYASQNSSRYLGESSRGSLFSLRGNQSQRQDQALAPHGESYSSELSPDQNQAGSPQQFPAATPPIPDRSLSLDLTGEGRSGLGASMPISMKERHPMSLSERQQSLRLSDLSRSNLSPLSPPISSKKKVGKDTSQPSPSSPHQGDKKTKQRRDSKMLGSVKKGVSSLMQWKLGSSRRMGSSQNLIAESKSTTAASAPDPIDADLRSQIERASARGLIGQLNGAVRHGKEATIYHAEKGTKSNGFDVAVKVYKRAQGGGGEMGDDSQRDLTQFQNISSERQLELWTIKEFRNLQKARKFGIPSPSPLFAKNNILFMQFMGTDGRPAPQLGELDLRRGNKLWRTLYKQIVEAIRRLYTSALLVHGNLNETNILVVPRYLIDVTVSSDSKEYEADTAVIIDFGHTVDSKHPDAIDLLRGDLQTVRQFFAKQGIRTPNVDATLQFVTNNNVGGGGDSAPMDEGPGKSS